MDKRFDGHVWIFTKTSNIKNQFNLVSIKNLYAGHLQCGNEVCSCLLHKSTKNKTKWDGSTSS
jgi:hypothetical protein